ncbi:pyrroloquinoline quinone biosynthesis protein PqqB [Aquincola sp. MAHUQ-54]|uniref:Coenzyme PQQ synthesis protein B n=1 Tax=Aquincola agrisoli TaxID=3119538 RepID=A0AAW9QEG1_9BURK
MRITVLGSAAGGGFPQWNCNCRNCAGLRAGTLRTKARTQSSIFIRPDGGADGVLFNASPDILAQIRANPELQPGRALRDSAIAGVVLMDGQIDHVTGLFMLRERSRPAPERPGGRAPDPLPLWCTDAVAEDLTTGHPVFRVLGHYCGVDRHAIALDGTPFEVPGVPDLLFRAMPLDSKAAPYSPHRERGEPGDNLGITVTDRRSGGRLFYAPGLAAVTPAVFDAMSNADAVMVDGTFWTDDEMITTGAGPQRARAIGHLPQSGEGGMLEVMARLPAATRKLLIHINNTNPILDEDSAPRAEVARAGVEVCEDGMHIEL